MEIPEGFKPIPRAADNYAVSSRGVVFNVNTGRALKQWWDGHNHYTINPRKKGPRAGEVHMISEIYQHGSYYVKLIDPETKKPRVVGIKKLLSQLWDEGSQYQLLNH